MTTQHSTPPLKAKPLHATNVRYYNQTHLYMYTMYIIYRQLQRTFFYINNVAFTVGNACNKGILYIYNTFSNRMHVEVCAF